MFNVKGKKSKALFSSSDGEVDNNALHRTKQVNKTSKITNNDEDEEEIEQMHQNLTQRLKENNINNNLDYFNDDYPGNNIQNSNNARKNDNNFEKFTVEDDTSEDDESYNIFGSTKLRTNVKEKLPEMQNPLYLFFLALLPLQLLKTIISPLAITQTKHNSCTSHCNV
jgi:hypothetical protein